MELEKLRAHVVQEYGEIADSVYNDTKRLAALEVGAAMAGFDGDTLNVVTIALETLVTAYDCLVEAEVLSDGLKREQLRVHEDSDVKNLAERMKTEEGISVEEIRGRRVAEVMEAVRRRRSGEEPVGGRNA